MDESEVNNSELFLLALYRRGGAGRYIDVEDVFIEMWQLAPERFGWRKYPYPNYEVCRHALSDLTRGPRHGGDKLLMKTNDGLARQLTADGVRWVESRMPAFQEIVQGAIPPPDKRPSQRALASLQKHAAVRAFLSGQPPHLERYEAAAILRSAPDAPTAHWRERWESLRAAALNARRDELTQFLEWLEHTYPDWFRETT